jgi:hypothetical protein
VAAGESGFPTLRARHQGKITGPPSAVQKWSVASIEIDAKLRAYLPERVAADWRAYSDLTGYTLNVVLGGEIYRPDIFNQSLRDRRAARIANDPNYKLTIHRLDSARNISFGRPPKPGFSREFDFRIRVIIAYDILEVRLLQLETVISSEVLAAHVSGYSTSTSDLLHNLVP